jgi:hypothetical protein
MIFHNKPFKKDITAFAKGGKVVKHVGKGATEQSRGRGMDTITGADQLSRMANSYPKTPSGGSVGNLGGPPTSTPPVPMGSQSSAAPTAMMPPSEPDEDDVV